MSQVGKRSPAEEQKKCGQATKSAQGQIKKSPISPSFFRVTKPNKKYDFAGDLNDQCRDAVKSGDFSGVKTLIGAGATVTYTDGQQNTFLHLAAIFNHTDIALFLAEKGANPNQKNASKETAISVAQPTLAFKLQQISNDTK